jgi:hypothetical protein
MKVLKIVTDWQDVPLVLDLPLAARIVGQSPENLKKRAQRGDFPAYKEGNQWRVAKSSLMKHVGSAGTSSQCPNETTQ